MLFFNGLKGEEAFGAKPDKEVDLVPDYEIIDAPDFDYELEVVTEGLSIENSQSKSGGRETEPAPSTSSAEKNVEMEEEDQPDGRVQNEVVEQRNSRELSLNHLHLYSAYLLTLFVFGFR